MNLRPENEYFLSSAKSDLEDGPLHAALVRVRHLSRGPDGLGQAGAVGAEGEQRHRVHAHGRAVAVRAAPVELLARGLERVEVGGGVAWEAEGEE